MFEKKAKAPAHGPQWSGSGQVEFRLWAPSAQTVELSRGEQRTPMRREADGWYSVTQPARSGERYQFKINGDQTVPDPASRCQPEDTGGPSELVDPAAYSWRQAGWLGRPWEEAVVYELHVGTFSPKGNYAGVEEKLDYLVDLGVTAIELLPIAEFAGARGWGYDGVFPYAPESSYGTPDELRRLIDAAHGKGLMVFLDVVYNHFGPEGNRLHEYADAFFTEKYHTPWGAAINFEGQEPVRRFFIDNALYWINEYRFDGLRFDAVHAITDSSDRHFLYQLAEEVRAAIPQGRMVHLILENDHNEARYIGGDHFTAQWNDDIHHVFHVIATGETSGYYQDYKDNLPVRLGRCLTQGFAYQGEASANRKGEPRGERSAHLSPASFIAFAQNHDQIGNRALGERIAQIADERKLTLVMAILLLSPQPPMLFMGEEWQASTPFLYFCDFHGELAAAVREGRRKEFACFPEFSNPELQARIPDPNARETFERSRLDWAEKDREPHHKHLAFTQSLLALRREHVVPLLQSGWVKNSVAPLGEQGLEVRWQYNGGELILVANLSDRALHYAPDASASHLWGNFQEELPAWKCALSVKVRSA